MRKRILSFILILILLVALLPSALAEDGSPTDAEQFGEVVEE